MKYSVISFQFSAPLLSPLLAKEGSPQGGVVGAGTRRRAGAALVALNSGDFDAQRFPGAELEPGL